ncbi:MAG TPA: TonB-dependent receptor [Rhizomicrobium sp.]|nr:TonB-dependent receptor [Rhizomicrobium sp.]
MSNRFHLLRRQLLGATSVLAAFACMNTPVHAQTSEGTAAPEVVTVTAERRATDIQTTPLAISAISGDALQKSNVMKLADINGLVPSLQVTSSAGFETVVTIRGVGLETPENSLTTSPGIALFVDGAYVANSVTLDQTFFDVDHVEVLRGPQGALYGQSATGGAILLVTRQANLDGWSGEVEGAYGTYNLHREFGEVNIPIADDLAVHIAVQQYQHDGFSKDPLIPNYQPDNADDIIGKIDFLWQPTSNFSVRLSSESYHADQDAAAQKNINDPDPDPREITQDYGPKFNMATNLSHLTVEWDASWFTVKSVTGYQWLDNVQGEDSSRSAFSILGAYDDVAGWDTSLVNYNEEFDLQSNSNSPFQWDVGTFLLSQKSSQFVEEFECAPTYGPCAAPTPAALTIVSPYGPLPGNLDYGNLSEVDRKSWSIFGQATYQLTDALSATLGGRLNSDSYADNSYNFSAFGTSNPDNKSLDHVPTYRAELDYKLNPAEMVYVSTNRGYKPAGVNGIYGQSYQCTSPFTFGGCNTNAPLLIPNEFKPETNTSYEVGSKNSWLDNHLIANFAAFYYDYKDMQYLATDPVPFDGGIVNIPSTHIYGAEAEVHYTGLEDHLHMNGNLSLENGAIQGNYKTIDSTVANQIENTSPACAAGAQYYYPGCWYTVLASAKDIGGNPPAKMPKVLGSFNASYDYVLGWGTLTPRFEVVYRGAFWARVFDEPSLDRVPAYTIVNLNLDFVPPDSNFKLSLTATNVGDTAGVDSRYTDPYGTGQTSQQYIPPRQIIGTISYNF